MKAVAAFTRENANENFISEGNGTFYYLNMNFPQKTNSNIK